MNEVMCATGCKHVQNTALVGCTHVSVGESNDNDNDLCELRFAPL